MKKGPVFLVLALGIGLGLSQPTPVSAAASDPPAGMPLLFSADFEDGKMDAFEPTDPKAWKIAEDGGGKALSLFGKSDYKPEVRSPLNIALLKEHVVGDFVLEAKLRSTTKDYDHRDLCLIFGHRDPSHFYYVHFALKSDDHANSIFIVNGSPRLSIAKTRTNGTVWSEKYHTVRVVRKAATGEIAVYFDDLEKPAMTAQDATFKSGRVGLGSFDDTGNFDDVKLWGVKAKN